MSTVEHRFTLPHALDAESLSAFAIELHAAPPADVYEVDFGHERFFSPFSMVLLAMHLKRFRAAHPDAVCRAVNFDNHGYAAHMGFFKLFGLDHGNAPGQASGSSRYVPIQELSASDFELDAISLGVPVGEAIERKARVMATLITQSSSGGLHDALTFSIREIIRNVIEHSESSTVMICGQYWPYLRRVEVGIADTGRGIRAGLSDNPRFEFDNDRDALQMALLPGVSGNIAAGKGSDVWQNSGYGLYMTSRICRAGGRFFIASGTAGIALDGNRKADIRSDLQGTAVRLSLSTADMGDLDRRLAKFKEEGVAVARQIKGAVRVSPSVASQMLSRDFNLS